MNTLNGIKCIFSGMHTFTTYKEVRHRVELKVEHLMETIIEKPQSTVMKVHARPKTKMLALKERWF